MVKHYWQRAEEAKQALLAAREALDAAERRLEGYHRALESERRVYKGYQRDEYAQIASRARKGAMEELNEAVRHVGDAIRAWWPNLTTSFWVTDGPAGE